jgi:hypothetical protein
MLSACQIIENGAQRDWPDSFNADEHVDNPAAAAQPLATYKILITYSVI